MVLTWIIISLRPPTPMMLQESNDANSYLTKLIHASFLLSISFFCILLLSL